jgi:hypothetical protein
MLKQSEELRSLQRSLSVPEPLTIVAYSAYPSTRALLTSALHGFRTSIFSSLAEVKQHLSSLREVRTPTADVPTLSAVPDFVVLDATADEVDAVVALAEEIPDLRTTRVVHLFVRTAETLNRVVQSVPAPQAGRVMRCSKPLRPLALLRLLVQGREEALRSDSLTPTPTAETMTSPLKGEVSFMKVGGTETPRVGRPQTMLKPAAKTGAAPKLANNFSAEELEWFKSVRILIAEGECPTL